MLQKRKQLTVDDCVEFSQQELRRMGQDDGSKDPHLKRRRSARGYGHFNDNPHLRAAVRIPESIFAIVLELWYIVMDCLVYTCAMLYSVNSTIFAALQRACLYLLTVGNRLLSVTVILLAFTYLYHHSTPDRFSLAREIVCDVPPLRFSIQLSGLTWCRIEPEPILPHSQTLLERDPWNKHALVGLSEELFQVYSITNILDDIKLLQVVFTQAEFTKFTREGVPEGGGEMRQVLSRIDNDLDRGAKRSGDLATGIRLLLISARHKMDNNCQSLSRRLELISPTGRGGWSDLIRPSIDSVPSVASPNASHELFVTISKVSKLIMVDVKRLIELTNDALRSLDAIDQDFRDLTFLISNNFGGDSEDVCTVHSWQYVPTRCTALDLFTHSDAIVNVHKQIQSSRKTIQNVHEKLKAVWSSCSQWDQYTLKTSNDGTQGTFSDQDVLNTVKVLSKQAHDFALDMRQWEVEFHKRLRCAREERTLLRS